MAKNVALFGQFCAGKTTLAKLLSEEYGYVVRSLASNLKDMTNSVYGTSDKGASVIVQTENGPESRTVREVLQGLGDAVKTVDRDFWIRWFLSDCQDYSNNSLPVVCDDGRMAREADRLREEGWLLVLVDTPEDLRVRRFVNLYGRTPSEKEMKHRTEQELGLIRFDLTVDGTLPIERQGEIVVASLWLDMMNDELGASL